MRVTLNLPGQKFNFLMELLNNFEYVHIEKSEITDADNDWWDDLTPKQQERIEESLSKLDRGEFVSNEAVRAKANKLLRG